MKKLNRILHILMGGFTGVFLGRSIYAVWRFYTRPGSYGMQSAPWYTSILVEGIFTLVFVLVCLGIKALAKAVGRRRDRS